MSIMARAAFLIRFVIVCTTVLAGAQDHPTVIERGKQSFFQQGCIGCHTIGQVGTPIGPDLSHVGRDYSVSYLRGWLRDPASQKRAAHMPRIDLTEEEIHALAAYLASLQ